MKAFICHFLPGSIASLVMLLTMALPAAAQAEQAVHCGGYADLLADLDRSYGEVIVWQGRRGDSGRMVITAAPDGSTWTALLVLEDGFACVGAVGVGWVAVPFQPAGEAI